MEFDSLTITIILVLAAIIIGIISRKRSKDRCLLDFDKSPVTIEKIDGTVLAKGVLKVKTTGMIINFPKTIKTHSGFLISSYLLYKYEFDLIQAIIRPHEELSEKGLSKRNNKLRKTYRPSLFRKIIRKIRNLFNALKDSFLEIMNISLSYLTARKTALLTPHDKYVRKLNNNLLESVGMSHEPLIEPFIGHYVVFELIKSKEKIKLSGVLKDYTKDYIEITDVKYTMPEEKEPQMVDMIVPQKLAVIRHFSGKIPYNFPFLKEIRTFALKINKVERNKEKNSKQIPTHSKSD